MSMKKIIKFSRLQIILFVMILAFFALLMLPSLYSNVVNKKYTFNIDENIYGINFEQLAQDLTSTVRPDDGKLLKFGGPIRLNVDRNGNLKKFNSSFIVFKDNKSLHFQTNYLEGNKLLVKKSWDVDVVQDEVPRHNDFGFMLKLLDRIPWEHVMDNISTKEYDDLTISNIVAGDGEGNIRGDAIMKSFLIKRDGQMIQFSEDTLLPADQYQVINFTPNVYENNVGSGRVEVQYFFEI